MTDNLSSLLEQSAALHHHLCPRQVLGVRMGMLATRAQELQAQGFTVSAVAERTTEGLTLKAIMAFGDEPKPGAREALEALRARGIRTVMISGDNRGAAEAMARRLGLRPEEGEVMAEVVDNDPAQQDSSGILALQLHTGPTTTAQFKDIRLKVLE